MRTIVVAVLVLVVALSIAAAAQTPDPAPRAGQRQAFANRLGLTADQIQQITDIRKQLMTDIKGLKDASVPRPQKVTKVKELVGAASDAVYNILTPEQRDKVAKAAIGARLLRLPRKGAMAFMGFLKNLDLTDAQKAQVKTIVTDNAAQLKAIREDTSLTPAQKMEKLRPLRKAVMDKILSILTPAQREKADAAIKKIGAGAGRGQGLRGAGAGRTGAGQPGARRQGRQGAARNTAAPAGDAELDVDALLN